MAKKYTLVTRQHVQNDQSLTIPVSIPYEKKKLFSHFFVVPQKVYEDQPYEAPQRSTKVKIKVSFYHNTTFWKCTGWEGERLFFKNESCYIPSFEGKRNYEGMSRP